MSSISPQILTLTHEEQRILDALVNQWNDRRAGNLTRAHYYDSKNAVQNLGIAVPPYMMKLDSVLGWPAKAVDGLGNRIVFENFVLPGADLNSTPLPELLDANYWELLVPQGITSTLLHGTAFITTTMGDTEAGEPEVIIGFRDALTATGLFDPRRRELSCALSIIETSEDGRTPTNMIVYTPFSVLFLEQRPNGTWDVQKRSHSLGRVPVEPVVYRPRIGRPFGTSRITRPVMSITDAAMRTVVRSEVGAEFFSAPQRVLLGADERAFMDEDGKLLSQWEAIIGRVWVVPPFEGEDGQLHQPSVQQMPQVSMQPHTDQLRSFAMQLAAETNLAVGSLGIIQDNPSSADAIYAAKEDLLLDAESAHRSIGVGLNRAARNAVEIAEDREVPELAALRSRWRDPSTPSRAASTDAVTKQIAAGVLPPDSEVTWELLGFDQTTIERLKADQRRARGSRMAEYVAQRAAQARENPDVVALETTRPEGA